MTKRGRHIGWRYWLALDILLALGLSGVAPAALPMAIAVGIVQSIHYLRREGRWSAFPVQVRVAYLGLLAAGLWAPLAFIHWIQLAGTTALLTLDYCPLARTLSLAPWNRRAPLTAALVRCAFFSPPTPGSVIYWLYSNPALRTGVECAPAASGGKKRS